jgi:hypothetical protein
MGQAPALLQKNATTAITPKKIEALLIRPIFPSFY